MSQPAEPSSHGIWSPSFQGLLWTQWLTSINDNVFRWFVIGVGKNQCAPEDQGTLLIIGSSFFIIPYILFASVAGWLADRFRKRTVIIGCKIAEIAIMIIGVIAVSLLGEPDPASGIDPFFWILLAAVFLMGLQSALFSPAKLTIFTQTFGLMVKISFLFSERVFFTSLLLFFKKNLTFPLMTNKFRVILL